MAPTVAAVASLAAAFTLTFAAPLAPVVPLMPLVLVTAGTPDLLHLGLGGRGGGFRDSGLRAFGRSGAGDFLHGLGHRLGRHLGGGFRRDSGYCIGGDRLGQRGLGRDRLYGSGRRGGLFSRGGRLGDRQHGSPRG